MHPLIKGRRAKILVLADSVTQFGTCGYFGATARGNDNDASDVGLMVLLTPDRTRTGLAKGASGRVASSRP